MAKPRTKPTSSTGRGVGRPAGETPPPPVTGLRIPAAELAAIDAWVDSENEKNPLSRATRSSVLLGIIRNALAKERGWKPAEKPKGEA